MKLVRASGTKTRRNSKNCLAFEYHHDDPDLNIARVEIRGRYPDEDLITNTGSKMIVFVLSGEGTVTIEGEPMEVGPGDAVLIEKEERYFWNGHLDVLAAGHPSWTTEQHLRKPG